MAPEIPAAEIFFKKKPAGKIPCLLRNRHQRYSCPAAKGDVRLFQHFLQRTEVIGLSADDAALIEKIIVIRQQYRLKLPDAIIAAMALQRNAVLVTADREFVKAIDLTVINWT